ncbi:zinc finger BED domain-containing protein RICESLEEPER 1-like [Rutidosis leptorrhynchoides]|uniref:zinc finger BED domain-containing protein RICESLEEPER 1-like n=1 Tax=Rutidosis leptorrhynchoides TaxID=125765 RepID=UPI003A98F995
MKAKFDTYWGECHLLMAIASVLDPKFKKWLIGMSYHILYEPDQAVKNIKEVEDALEDMYNEYREMHDASVKEVATIGIGSSKGCNYERYSEDASNGTGWQEYEKFIKGVDLRKPQVSELQMYYDEGLHILQGGMDSFNVLEWWNIHKMKFHVLSKMAKDVLAIPISTVASEATFSAGGRVIEPFRSSLAPETVEMLLCGGDWVRQTFGLKKKVKEELPHRDFIA